jgi:hypothetical protein
MAEFFSHTNARGPTRLQLRRPLAYQACCGDLRTMLSSRQPKKETAHTSWTTLLITVNPVSYVLR